MSVEIVSVDRLFFQYNSSEVLSDISFNLYKGDYLGLVGPNGSGKTTLIKVLLGLHKPSKGSVRLFGRDPAAFEEWHRVGYLPQKIVSFNPHFPASAKEIVALGLLSRKKLSAGSGRPDCLTVEKAMDLMDITNLKNKLIGELSGGQLQRVLLAKAMMSMPELLILDEPTTALDPETRERFFALLRRLNEKEDLTIVIITHDVGTIGKYASKLLYLDKKIVFFGSLEAFCISSEMSSYFGEYSQHVICHRHDPQP